MSPVSLSTVPTAAIARRPWNTPRLLKASRTGLLGLLGLLLIAIVTGTGVHRDAMKTVGKDAAPSIIAAQHIKAALADMDADAADSLLAGSGEADLRAAYDGRRQEAAKALLTAAENITYGESERGPIQTLELGLGSYEGLIQRARDLRAEGRPDAPEAYREAAAVMDGTLLPATDALDRANHTVLERVYGSQSARSAGARGFVVFAGALAMLALAGVQFFLTQRTRRLVNPFLVAATLLVGVAGLHAWSAMEAEQEDIRVADEDAFTSIHALWQARAVAYEANGNQSRALVDPARAMAYERAFANETESLAELPPGLNADQLLAAVRNSSRVAGFSGYLADELNNITFPGERDAALSVLADFELSLKNYAQLEHLEATGQTKAAIAFDLGAGPGAPRTSFQSFDDALGRTLAINQTEFELAVAKGFGALSKLEGVSFAMLALAAGLVFVGLGVRIGEYR